MKHRYSTIRRDGGLLMQRRRRMSRASHLIALTLGFAIGRLLQLPMDPAFATLVGVVCGLVAGVILTILVVELDP